MMIKEFPYMHQFCYGAFSTNSGGQYEDTGNMKCCGTPEQWQEAEAWLKNYCRIQCEWVLPDFTANETTTKRVAWFLGADADEGMAICGQFYQEDEAKNVWGIDPTDTPHPAPPWLLLNKYY